MPIPTQYQTAIPYLIVENASAFLFFVQNLFDADITELHHRDEAKVYVMHAELKIGNATIMCANTTEQWTAQPAGIFIYVENADDTYHKAIRLGCTSIMELCDQPYGRTSGVKDMFGNTWWITSV
ncbi:MAG: VOC family protein [Chitinophagales bacterium]